MKKCIKCECEKDETQFFKKRNGLAARCKTCKRIENKEWFDRNREENLTKDRERAKKKRENPEWKKWRDEYRKKNKEKITLKCREYRLENKDHLEEKAREWRSKNKESYTSSVKLHNKKNPEKVRARKILNYHISKGNMTKPIICSGCKSETKIYAHHDDYTKPLDIRWLCKVCHGIEHRIIK